MVMMFMVLGETLVMVYEVIYLQQESGMVKGGLFVKAEPIPISLNSRTNVTTNFTISKVTSTTMASPGFFNLSIE